MNCLILLLLLCCSGNGCGNNGCGNSCGGNMGCGNTAGGSCGCGNSNASNNNCGCARSDVRGGNDCRMKEPCGEDGRRERFGSFPSPGSTCGCEE